MSRTPPPPSQVFRLFSFDRRQSDLLVITPEPINHEIVSAAWGYAVRYTAKGLDLPDHEAAVKLLKERHPSWTYLHTHVLDIPVHLSLAEKDVPES